MIKSIVSGRFDSSLKRIKQKLSPKRKVSQYEIEFYESDYFYTCIDQTKYPCRQNTFIIAKPNQIRNSKLHFQCRYIHLQLEDCEIKDLLDKLPSQIYIVDSQKYLEILENINRLSFSLKKNYYFIISDLYKLIASLREDAKKQIINQKNLSNINAGIFEGAKFIENNFSLDICLLDIAKSANLSPNYFHKKFKEIYGITPQKYLFDARMENAKYLLLNSDYSISEIAIRCGFNSQTYFNYQFKNSQKITPFSYRKNHLKDI